MNESLVSAASSASAIMNSPVAALASQGLSTTQVDMGFVHFISHTDWVGQGLFFVLVIMSVLVWSLMVGKGWLLFRQQARSRAYLDFFWNATSLQAVHAHLEGHGAHEPFAKLTVQAMRAQAHHARFGASKLEEAGSAQEFLTRTIKKVLDEETMRMESGLSLLATIGATAPFVGLFGTVWGVYHALLAIGATGAGTLDKVAGPVGEALVMTGVGLAVAIPAVMGYNWLARRNRVWGARLDAFAFELFTFLSTGQTLKTSAAQAATR